MPDGSRWPVKTRNVHAVLCLHSVEINNENLIDESSCDIYQYLFITKVILSESKMLTALKKKKNVVLMTAVMASCFILYQLYFFLTITSETSSSNRLIAVLDQVKAKQLMHVRSEHDKYINENGVIRGVHFSQVKYYRPNSKNEFKCRNSEQHIPFEYVNDDFCDCDDGTDEPSTNACPSGVFYCDTQFPKSSINYIPSGQLNDGICDCCDGSDEWLLAGKRNLLGQSGKNNIRHYTHMCPNLCQKIT